MKGKRRRWLVLMIVLVVLSAGCGKSAKYVPSGSGGGSEHFASLRAGGGQATDHLVNGQRVGDGLVHWGLPAASSGNDTTVVVTFYFGPFGTDDNTVLSGEQPQLLPNYADGAETGRGAGDYDPVLLNPVAGSNNQLWQVVFTRFPTTGTFLCTLKRGANAYVAGQPRDSSYDSARQNLKACYDASRVVITTPGKQQHDSSFDNVNQSLQAPSVFIRAP